MQSEIILTPTTSGSSSYRVTWTSSYYNTSRYMITVYPPESYTQEDLIHNTDNSTVHNITIALNDCPHRIYSTFIPSKNVITKKIGILLPYYCLHRLPNVDFSGCAKLQNVCNWTNDCTFSE